MENNSKSVLALVITGLIFLVSLGVSIVITRAYNGTLTEQQSQIDVLTNKVSVMEVEQSNKDEEVFSNVTGLNRERTKRDDEIITEFLDTVFTWSSYEEYQKAREAVMDEYKIKEDSDFINIFMPKITNSITGGNEYNRIDEEGLNMSYSGFKSYVSNVSSDIYTYVAEVSVASSYKVDGNEDVVESNSYTAIEYGIDREGNITDIKAYPLAK